MHIRQYIQSDKEQCLAIFRSNCPLYFDESEYVLFEKWLDHMSDLQLPYHSPAYSNSDADAFYVLEHNGNGIVACGGFYILKESPEARFAWGMVHAESHKKGLGTALFEFRVKEIKERWPEHAITLGTSQHTYPFYERMGFKVVQRIEKGYGEDLDRYDMVL